MLVFAFQEHGSNEITIVNPAQFPDRSVVSEYLEPMVKGTILAPDSYTGKIMTLCLVRCLLYYRLLYRHTFAQLRAYNSGVVSHRETRRGTRDTIRNMLPTIRMVSRYSDSATRHIARHFIDDTSRYL